MFNRFGLGKPVLKLLMVLSLVESNRDILVPQEEQIVAETFRFPFVNYLED